MANRKGGTVKFSKHGIVLSWLTALCVVAQAQVVQEWKCILYGDTRNNTTAHKEVLASMKRNTPDYKFIINVGDVVDYGYTESQWVDWQTSCNSYLGGLGQDSVPPKYMACPGNHDQLSNPLGLANWNKYLPGQNTLYGNNGMFFTFDYREARFVILDSEFSQRDGAQYQMLVHALEDNPKKWLIALWHKPLFSFGEKSYQDALNKLWGTILYEKGCDLVANGDAHYYVRTKRLRLNGDKYPPLDSIKGVTMLVTGNGGAPIDVPNPLYDGNTYMIAQYARTNQDYGYTELQFRDSAVTLRHIFRNGSVFDEVVLKPNPKYQSTTSASRDNGVVATQIQQNYPNPFNPITDIRYEIAGVRDQGSGTSSVKLVVYDLLGREVAALVNERKEPGSYSVRFDAGGLAGGVYFYRITVGDFVQTKKLVLQK